jgi:beta-fructofuranosidase
MRNKALCYMAFRLTDKWVWDFWFAQDGSDYHMYYLQADRNIGDPDKRHFNTSLGHAISQDLVSWKNLGTCFEKSKTPAWDDTAIWSGSVLKHENRWYLFYTALSQADNNKIQRIGMASSPDLHHWQRATNGPILECDDEHYDPEHIGHLQEQFCMQVCRDPYVIPDPNGKGFRMYFTARHRHGPADGRGAIGIAHSEDLYHWQLSPPVTPAGDFNECEVPQYLEMNGHYYLIFSVASEHYSEAYRQHLVEQNLQQHLHDSGTHYYIASHPNGPWRLGGLPFFAGNPQNTHYCGKIINNPQGHPVLMAFRNLNLKGEFLGEISNPIPILKDNDGALKLAINLQDELSSSPPLSA